MGGRVYPRVWFEEYSWRYSQGGVSAVGGMAGKAWLITRLVTREQRISMSA